MLLVVKERERNGSSWLRVLDTHPRSIVESEKENGQGNRLLGWDFGV
jgi:hypothetical protein